jgi:ankyrin repeat protein
MDIFIIIESGDLEGVKQWLTIDPDINKPNNNGMTPINSASYFGHITIVKLLLAQPGIDFNKPDNNGETPIYGATYYGHAEIFKLLLAQPGIHFNKANGKGKKPLNNASFFGRTEIVHILEEYEKNPIKMRNFYLRKYFPHIIEEYFILMVLCSDDYFVCTNKGEIERFFKIVIKMPQELQSLIANRIIGSSCDIPRLSFINEAIKKFFN